MTHERTQELLSAYIDGDLRPDERAEVEAHLEQCAGCREELALLQLTLDALHDLPALEAPAGFADAVLDRIDAEAETGATVIPFRRVRRAALVAAPLMLAAAAMLVVGVVWWVSPWRYVGSHEDLTSAPVAESSTGELQRARDGLADSGDEPARSRREGGKAELESDGDSLADDFAAAEEEEEEILREDGRLAEASPSPDSIAGLPVAPSADEPAAAAATAEERSSVFFAPWEQGEGDAVADTGVIGGAPTGGSVELGDTRAGSGGMGRREQERLAQEDQAFRSMYGESSGSDLDALVDAEPEQSEAWDDDGRARERREAQAQPRSAAGMEFAAADDEDSDRSYDRYGDAGEDDFDAMVDEIELEEADEEAAYEAVEIARTRRGSPASSGRASRDRGSARKKAAESLDTAPVARAPSPAEDVPAVAAQSITVTEEPAVDLSAASPPDQAEWTVQATDAGVLFRLAELCTSDTGLACAWTSPNAGPVSLNAQQNYQLLEVTLAHAGYGTLQTRMRALGNVLVRSEDIALAGPADPITVRIVIEYLP